MSSYAPFKYIAVFLCFLLYNGTALAAQNPTSVANSVNSQLQNAYGSGGSIQNNAITPLMSNTQMKTVNGQTSFNAQLECPSAQNLLTLNFLPQSSGDFDLLITQSNPGQSAWNAQINGISGVCTDGYIVCEAGTWSGCNYYQWSVNANGDIVSVQQNTLQPLGSCFCVNNSCGGLFNSDFQNIASTIGGGIANIVSETDDIAVTNATFNMQAGYQLNYAGQSVTQCTTLNGSSGSNPQQYYNNTAGMSNGAQTEATAEYSNSNSAYYSLSNNEYLNTNPVQQEECIITSSATIQTTTSLTNAFCSAGSWDYLYGHNGSTITLLNGCFANANYSHNSGTTTATQYELSCPSGYSLTSQDFVASGSIVSFPDGDGWGGTWTIDPSIYEPNACLEYVYTPQVSHSNGCATLANNSQCKLETKEICDQNGANCVYTVQNYEPSTITPQSMCETINNPTVTTPNFGSSSLYYFNICANGNSITYTSNDPANLSGTLVTSSNNNDYWVVRETYTCNSSSGNYDFSSMENTTNQVNSSLKSSGYSSYTANGTTASPNYSGNAIAAGLGNTPCTYSCVVETNQSNSQALDTNASTTNQALSGTTPSNTVALKTVLTCTQPTSAGNTPNNNNWQCPATPDETVVKSCQCLNEGNYAIATASVLGTAAQDMICSAN